MSNPNHNPEIVVVFGHGLAAVRKRGEDKGRAWVEYVDHGYPIIHDAPRRITSRWVWADGTRTMTDDEARTALQLEQREARARDVACTTRNCWCRTFITTETT